MKFTFAAVTAALVSIVIATPIEINTTSVETTKADPWTQIPACATQCVKDAASAIGCGGDIVCMCRPESEAGMAANGAECVINGCGMLTALSLRSKLEKICKEYQE